MTLTSSDVLFVGKGFGVVPWYRTGMPAFNLGCDWIGIEGTPPNAILKTSLKRGGHSMPDLSSYRVVVLQQVAGPEWIFAIRRLQKRGVKVIYEVDDYLHGVRKIQSHRAKGAYTKKNLKDFEMCMRVCDAMIVSTEWLQKKYRVFNPNIFVCRNGIEYRRYSKFNLPERKTLNIGWAGGEGHLESVLAWLPAIEKILWEYEHTRFVSVGLPVAELLTQPTRAVALPFVAIENFPAVLCNFDISIAPAGRGTFFQAKSDLRWLETGALGIPLVADPFVYGEIDHNLTGFHAENHEEAYIGLKWFVEDRYKRQYIGHNVREHIAKNRSIEKVVDQWEAVFVHVADS